MGFFSWNTSDTQESIMNIHSGLCKTVYMLQPNGLPNIKEVSYEGYGDFGGIDAYDWIADKNIKEDILNKAQKLGIEKRLLGIYIDSKYYLDTRSNKKYSYMLSELFDDLNPFPNNGNYGSDCDGVEINKLIKDGIWVAKPLSDFLGEIKYPLKFSFDENAKYENLPAANIAENQGF